MSTEPKSYDFSLFAHAYPPLAISATLKQQPEDFMVEEQLGYPLSGSGEHLWLWIEKKQQNTDWVARKLAAWLNTGLVNIGFAGQKDRQAITRQWFSVPCAMKQVLDLDSFQCEGVRILKAQRHDRKLRRGELAGNFFHIRLRHLAGSDNDCKAQIEDRLQQLKQGVPNYYGAQRFGKQCANLSLGERLLTEPVARDKKRRSKKRGGQRNLNSLALSAIRSWMFNRLLSARVEDGNWNSAIAGDSVIDGKVMGTLFGDQDLQTTEQAFEYESRVVTEFSQWYQGLRQQRVQSAQRAFCLQPKQLSWQWQDDNGQLALLLDFELPTGCFATVFLRELCELREPE
ncbi:tRNA pseudouridine(13) synthase TruD [Thiomicrorhabdus sediminis]|uniref:tRNA pseudouridine synthase D n=1 Tax=Thiomicrorhabdus sediminis TaxID=2580412 RepID=A0A4V1HHK5_9GAMM|nr:tRNA pseudouridine(13) synthase TruD [Thiomicrorhabdus sediminis]QCU89343.1 tRNA pseudouridine(13) synthase TruD [Thiomicrorhabdus sediminis]